MYSFTVVNDYMSLYTQQRPEFNYCKGTMPNSDEGGKDCPPILDENIEIEVIRPGKDANGDTSSNGRGSVLKVNCASGYELNLPKRKVQKLRNCFKQLDI